MLFCYHQFKRCCIMGKTSPDHFNIVSMSTRKNISPSEKEDGTRRGDHTSMSELPAGTVTLLFTDIEGSTRLLQQLGERYANVLAECRELLRQVFAQYHGHEV